MSDKANKHRPIEERIAALFGSSTFREPIGGFSGIVEMPNADVIGALAIAKTQAGDMAVRAVEVYFGGMAAVERHGQALAESYYQTNAKPETKADRIIRNFCTQIGLRSHAGVKYSQLDHLMYARLLETRRETVTKEIRAAESYLSDLTNQALTAFWKAVRRAA